MVPQAMTHPTPAQPQALDLCEEDKSGTVSEDESDLSESSSNEEDENLIESLV